MRSIDPNPMVSSLFTGSYEEVKLGDTDSEADTYVEDKGCQTGWELYKEYDQVNQSGPQASRRQ